MPDSYFSKKRNETENNFIPLSALTAVVEIMDYHYYVEADKFHELEIFYNELAVEIHNSQRKNYRRGFGVIKPEIRAISDRIYISSRLYLEKEVPEISSMVFKLFVEICNMLLAVALKHEIALRGYAGIDTFFNIQVSSSNSSRLEKEDTLMLSDMLKVFSFDEIFPEGLGKVYLPPASFTVLHGQNFQNACSLLQEINAIGIYMSDEIRKYPASELAIYSDMLIETKLQNKKVYLANWFQWAEKHHDDYPLEQARENIEKLSGEINSPLANFWKNFNDLSPLYSI